jgi:hypothetical protein
MRSGYTKGRGIFSYMFAYAALFVAAFIAAAIVLWLYRAVVGVGKVVYQAFLPSSVTEDSLTAHVKEERLPLTINDTAMPWGWGKHESPAQSARTSTVVNEDPVPWGWPGSKQEIREHHPILQLSEKALDGSEVETEVDNLPQSQIGWPYREEKFEFAGKAYKVVRKDAPERTDLGLTGTPWGW